MSYNFILLLRSLRNYYDGAKMLRKFLIRRKRGSKFFELPMINLLFLLLFFENETQTKLTLLLIYFEIFKVERYCNLH